jgi:hypothetical protein
MLIDSVERNARVSSLRPLVKGLCVKIADFKDFRGLKGFLGAAEVCSTDSQRHRFNWIERTQNDS